MHLSRLIATMFALGVASVSTGQERSANGWTYVVCGMKLNVFTGQTESSLPTVNACTAVTAAKIKVISSKLGRARSTACSAYAQSLVSLERVKAHTGLSWFGNFVCSQDCSGHLVGYQWAKTEKIQSQSQCPSNQSKSFEEGCWVYQQELEQLEFKQEHCQSDVQ